MSGGALKAEARRILERAYTQGDLRALCRLYASDVVCHRPPLTDIEGLAALVQYVSDLRRAFSHVRLALDEIILEGQTTSSRWTLRGTHTERRPSIPVPPTGREVTVAGCSVAHWRDGRVYEEWSYVDWLGLFRQLRIVPPMG